MAQSGVFTVKRGANAERVVYIKKSGTGAHRACRMQSFCEHAPTDVLREKKCLEAPGQVELDKADLRYAELDEVLVGDVPDRDHQVAACVGLPSLAARNGEARGPTKSTRGSTVRKPPAREASLASSAPTCL